MAAHAGRGFERSLVVSGQAPLPAIAGAAEAGPIVQYEHAVNAIVACYTIDEASTWCSKAEAMAAWAKIYADDRIAKEARALRLHAYRRIGMLAEQLAKQLPASSRSGRPLGANSILRQHGFNGSRSTAMLRLAQLPEERFAALAAADKPLSPTTLSTIVLTRAPNWRSLGHSLTSALCRMRKVPADALVQEMSEADRISAEEQAIAVCAWLGSFLSALSERKSGAAPEGT